MQASAKTDGDVGSDMYCAHTIIKLQNNVH